MVPMRRRDRLVTDTAHIRAILEACASCCIAFSCDGAPYLVPMCYGFDYDGEKLTLYLHCAKEGRKMELLRSGKPVGFEMHCGEQTVPGDNSCKFSLRYQSIVGVALPRELPQEQKLDAFRKIMAQYTDDIPPFSEAAVAFTPVFALDATEFSCKANV